MRKTARIICLILALIFILSLAPLSALAAEPAVQEKAADASAEAGIATVSDTEGNAPAQETAAPSAEESTVPDAPAENAEETPKQEETPAPEVNSTEPAQPEAVTKEEAVAQVVGGDYYKTLQEAVDNANNGEVVLIKDVDIRGGGIHVSGDVILDLDGHTVTAGNSVNENINVTGILTLCDSKETGKIVSATPYDSAHGSGVVCVSGENAKFVMNSGNIETVFADDAQNKGQFAVVLLDGADMDMEGGIINAGWYAIAGNGEYDTQDTRINIYGGEMYSTADYAIYLPQSGTTEIFKNEEKNTEPTIQGATGGIAIQRGTLNISAGVITSDGTGSTGDWTDGTTGLANAAVNVGAKYGDVTLNITGGKFTAGGDAVSLIKGDQYHNGAVTVTGGSFSSDPSEFVPFGYEASGTENNYTVGRIQKLVTKDENGVTVVDGIFTGTEQPSQAVGTGNEMKIASHTAKSIADAGKGFAAVNGSTTVTFDAAAMNKAAGKEVSISIKDAGALEGAKAAYSFEFRANGENLMPEGAEDNGAVTVSIAKPAEVANPQVWYVVNGVFVENMNAQLSGETLTFTANHLSTYAVTDGTPAETAMVKIGDVHYTSFKEAIENVKPGETITLIRNVENGDAVAVPESADFTIDFAGRSYTVSNPAEAAQGFVIGSNANVSMKNGTVSANAAGIKTIIENNGNLTLDNMVIEAGKTAAVSAKAGKVSIVNTTVNGSIEGEPENVEITSGAFSADPAKYAASGSAVAKITDDGNEKFYVGEENIQNAAKKLGKRDSVIVSQGNVAFTGLDRGVDVTNNGDGTVSLNGTPVAKGETANFCDHKSLQEVAERPATCKDKGMKAHFQCVGAEGCGKLFVKNEDGSLKQVTEADLEIPATNTHTLEKVNASQPECGKDGVKEHYRCTVCGKLFADEKGTQELTEKDVTIPATGKHELKKVEEVKATCTEDGVKEHWVCENCGKMYSDPEGKTEVTEKDLVIPATGHNPGIWRENDKEHWRVCRTCREKVDVGEHEFGEWVVTREATARLSGRRERECEVCGYVERDRIPATHGPKTGDESSIGLWVTLLSLSAAAVVGTVAYIGIKKKHSK